MKLNWIVLSLIGATVIVIVFAYFKFYEEIPFLPDYGLKNNVVLPEATGKVDTTMESLLQDALNDETAFIDEEKEYSFINENIDSANDIGQSYNENEF